MKYIAPDGTYPLYYGDIMLAHKGWKKGDPLPEGWVFVASAPAPEIGGYQVIEAGEPVEIDGVMTEVWTVRDMTQEERDVQDAPLMARQKLIDAGFSEEEIQALIETLSA